MENNSYTLLTGELLRSISNVGSAMQTLTEKAVTGMLRVSHSDGKSKSEISFLVSGDKLYSYFCSNYRIGDKVSIIGELKVDVLGQAIVWVLGFKPKG